MSAPLVADYQFIAPVYDRLIGDAGFDPIWTAFRQACQRHRLRFASMADIGCGTGRFLARLVGHVPGLTGVDRSAAMLHQARRRLAGTGVRLIRQDLMQLSLPEPVDLVTLNYNVLNYPQEFRLLLRALHRCRGVLRFHGHLLFDIMVRGLDCPNGGRPAGMVRQIIHLPDVRGCWDIKPIANGAGTMVRMHTCLRSEDGRWRCAHEQHRQRWWSWPAVAQALKAAGFRLLGVARLEQCLGNARWLQVTAACA